MDLGSGHRLIWIKPGRRATARTAGKLLRVAVDGAPGTREGGGVARLAGAPFIEFHLDLRPHLA
jgi:hypothetical protein